MWARSEHVTCLRDMFTEAPHTAGWLQLGLAWMLVIVFAYYVVNVFGSVLGQVL